MKISPATRAAVGLLIVVVATPMPAPAEERASGRVADSGWFVRAVLSVGDEVIAECADGSRGSGPGEQTGFFALSIADERVNPAYRHPTQYYFHMFTGRPDVAADIRVLDVRVNEVGIPAPIFDPGPPGPPHFFTWAVSDQSVLRVAWAQWNARMSCGVTVNGRTLVPEPLATGRARRFVAGDFNGLASAGVEQLFWAAAASSVTTRLDGYTLAMLLDETGGQWASDGQGRVVDSDPADDPILAIAQGDPGIWSFSLPGSFEVLTSPPLVLIDFPY